MATLTRRTVPALAPAVGVPPVDVVDEDLTFRLVLEIPGAVSESLTVEITGRLVTLRGERRATGGERGRFLRVERASGPFERRLELPEELDGDHARLSYADGLLTLEIPKCASRRGTRAIPIRRGPPA